MLCGVRCPGWFRGEGVLVEVLVCLLGMLLMLRLMTKILWGGGGDLKPVTTSLRLDMKWSVSNYRGNVRTILKSTKKVKEVFVP